jgi:hypothetical protein
MKDNISLLYGRKIVGCIRILITEKGGAWNSMVQVVV